MVTETHNTEEASYRFLIRANCSMTSRELIIIYGSLVLVSMSIALRFVFLGLWLVLPFTLLELGLLGGILYYMWSRRDDAEIISIADGTIRIEQRDRKGSREWSIPTYWAKLELAQSRHRNHPTRLLLRSHGKVEEIGRCLTDEEREKLSRELRHAIDQQQHTPAT